MEKQHEYIVLAFATAILGLFALITLGHASTSSGGNYSHPTPDGVVPGDIILGHSPDWADWVIPGYWTHTGILDHYDPNVGDWIVVEAYQDGVQTITLQDFMRRYDAVTVLRVSTSDAVRNNALAFARQRLGYPYDYKWWSKSIDDGKYYCAELAWAAYKVNGVDIDKHRGFSWTYLSGVAPQEIYDDGDTYRIFYHAA